LRGSVELAGNAEETRMRSSPVAARALRSPRRRCARDCRPCFGWRGADSGWGDLTADGMAPPMLWMLHLFRNRCGCRGLYPATVVLIKADSIYRINLFLKIQQFVHGGDRPGIRRIRGASRQEMGPEGAHPEKGREPGASQPTESPPRYEFQVDRLADRYNIEARNNVKQQAKRLPIETTWR